MDDIITVLIDIVSRLEKNRIPYFVSGSMARNLYAEPRFTNDIDIVIGLYEKQKSQIFVLFKDDFYISEQQIEDAFKKIGFFNIIHFQTNVKCDFILRKKDEFSQDCFKRRIKETIQNAPIYFISKEDLILQKLLWRKKTKSEQQLIDIERVIEHQKTELDRNYIFKWSRKLNLYNDLKNLL